MTEQRAAAHLPAFGPALGAALTQLLQDCCSPAALNGGAWEFVHSDEITSEKQVREWEVLIKKMLLISLFGLQEGFDLILKAKSWKTK